mmetsp:Transcript_59927/g.125314  ORF Transcript_59927/g.125314 Transcript_59927/m.125314 type:complete len:218 (+) Transcript_59927:450-1103(+)
MLRHWDAISPDFNGHHSTGRCFAFLRRDICLHSRANESLRRPFDAGRLRRHRFRLRARVRRRDVHLRRHGITVVVPRRHWRGGPVRLLPSWPARVSGDLFRHQQAHFPAAVSLTGRPGLCDLYLHDARCLAAAPWLRQRQAGGHYRHPHQSVQERGRAAAPHAGAAAGHCGQFLQFGANCVPRSVVRRRDDQGAAVARDCDDVVHGRRHLLSLPGPA